MKYFIGAFLMLALHWTNHLIYITNGVGGSETMAITSHIDDLLDGQVLIYPWWKR